MLLREARRLNTRNIVACVHPDNFASLALLSRLRFAFLEVLSGAGYAKWQQGHHRYVRAAGA
jgi:RimJ/RimL family protein N-acetyltransferase